MTNQTVNIDNVISEVTQVKEYVDKVLDNFENGPDSLMLSTRRTKTAFKFSYNTLALSTNLLNDDFSYLNKFVDVNQFNNFNNKLITVPTYKNEPSIYFFKSFRYKSNVEINNVVIWLFNSLFLNENLSKEFFLNFTNQFIEEYNENLPKELICNLKFNLVKINNLNEFIIQYDLENYDSDNIKNLENYFILNNLIENKRLPNGTFLINLKKSNSNSNNHLDLAITPSLELLNNVKFNFSSSLLTEDNLEIISSVKLNNLI